MRDLHDKAHTCESYGSYFARRQTGEIGPHERTKVASFDLLAHRQIASERNEVNEILEETESPAYRN
jgi:hypothetical protein